MATSPTVVQFREAVYVLKTTPGEATWLPFNENSPIEIFCDLSCDEVYFLLSCDFFTDAIVNAGNGRCKYYPRLLILRKTDNDQLQD